jgi:Ulp1 family protease
MYLFLDVPAVNKTLHWSLCVVVNPGAILDHREAFEIMRSTGSDGLCSRFSEDNPFPCLLFFDALKAHRKDRVANKVRAWLNSEWARLNPGDSRKALFDSKSMVIYSPKGTITTL